MGKGGDSRRKLRSTENTKLGQERMRDELLSLFFSYCIIVFIKIFSRTRLIICEFFAI